MREGCGIRGHCLPILMESTVSKQSFLAATLWNVQVIVIFDYLSQDGTKIEPAITFWTLN